MMFGAVKISLFFSTAHDKTCGLSGIPCFSATILLLNDEELERIMRLFTKLTLFLFVVGLAPVHAQQSVSNISPRDTLLSGEAIFDAFGFSVSLSGNRALVGAFRNSESDFEAGAAYIFEHDGESWSSGCKLMAAGGEESDWFGYAVSLHGDRALIGAFRDDPRGSNSGSVYVFDFDGTDWIQTHQLTASDGAAFDGFGFTVALAQDRAVIGARFDDDLGLESGAAYVFDFDGNDWIETQKLTVMDGEAGDEFGQTVALSENRLLVGATRRDALGDDSGAVYVFDFDGQAWQQTHQLLPSNGAAFDRFGNSLSLYGNTAVVGAQLSDSDQQDTGSVYIFEFDGAAWLQTQQIAAPHASPILGFGQSVSVADDRLLISAYNDTNQEISSGSAYLYTFDGDRWDIAAELSSETDLVNRHTGFAVSASQDKLLIGGRFGEIGAFVGSAFIVDLVNQPVAVDDAFVRINTTGRVRFDVLANDIGAFGQALMIESFTQPERGRVELFGSQLVYRARPGYCNSQTGPELFTYTLAGGSTAEVELTLLCINPFD